MLYSQLLEKRPKIYLYYWNRAKAYIFSNRTDEAIIDFNRAIKFDTSGNYQLLFDFGQLYASRNEYEKAAEYYRKASEMNTQCEICYNNLAIMNSLMYNSSEAVTNYQKAININSKVYSYWLNLGIEYKNLYK